MELIVVDPTYPENEQNREQFIQDLRNELDSLSSDIKIEDTDIGRGADWPAVLAVIGLFFLGKMINENLDAWIAIGKKFSFLLGTLAEKFGAYRIDQEGASLVAIARMVDRESGKIYSIEKISETIIPVSPLFHGSQEKLNCSPDALYLQIYKVNEDVFYIFGIKSKGSIEVEYRIDSSQWMEF